MHFSSSRYLCPSLRQGLGLGSQGAEDHFPTRAGQRAWQDASDSLPPPTRQMQEALAVFPPLSPRPTWHCGELCTVRPRAPECDPPGPAVLPWRKGSFDSSGNHRIPELPRVSDTMQCPQAAYRDPETYSREGASRGPLYSDGIRTNTLLSSVTIKRSFASALLYPLPPTNCTEYSKTTSENKVLCF